MPFTLHFLDDNGEPVYLQDRMRVVRVVGETEVKVRCWDVSRDDVKLFDTWSDADDARHVETDVITEVEL